MDPLLIAAYALVTILLVAGLTAAAIPFLPGTPLIVAGAIVYALAILQRLV